MQAVAAALRAVAAALRAVAAAQSCCCCSKLTRGIDSNLLHEVSIINASCCRAVAALTAQSCCCGSELNLLEKVLGF